MSETAVPITPHATLGDELRSVLRADAGWLTRNALLNRCELARDGDQLELELTRLFTRGLIQRRAGAVGLEYAALGTPAPQWEPRDARGPASSAEALVQTPPPPRAAIAVIREINVQQRLDAVRAQMVAMFKAQPLRARSEFDAALGRSQPIVSRYLRAMREEGLIETVGKGSALKFRWLGEVTMEAARPVVSDAAEPEVSGMAKAFSSEVWARREERTGQVPISDAPTVAPSEPEPIRHESVCESTQIHPEAARFAIWSDGQFQIQLGNDVVTLPVEATRRLFHFVETVGSPE